jgi:hypothetical protein
VVDADGVSRGDDVFPRHVYHDMHERLHGGGGSVQRERGDPVVRIAVVRVLRLVAGGGLRGGDDVFGWRMQLHERVHAGRYAVLWIVHRYVYQAVERMLRVVVTDGLRSGDGMLERVLHDNLHERVYAGRHGVRRDGRNAHVRKAVFRVLRLGSGRGMRGGAHMLGREVLLHECVHIGRCAV